MKWEYLGTGLTFLSLGLAVVLALPPPWWLKMPPLLVKTGLLTGLALIIFGVALAIMGIWPDILRPRLWPIITMAAGVLFFVVGGIWFGRIEIKSRTPKAAIAAPIQKEEPAFSWRWDALSEEETRKIAEHLQSVKPQPILVSCGSQNCSEISRNFRDLFQKLSWTVNYGNGPAMAIGRDVTGISISGNEEIGNRIKKAIEIGRSTVPVSVSSPSRFFPSGEIVFIVGSKPTPSPLPQAYGYDDLDAPSKMFDRRVEFSKETQSKFSTRFGAGVKVYASKLSEIGIEMPFSVQTAESEPVRFGKWFGAMGSLIEQGQVEEARKISANDRLWFAN